MVFIKAISFFLEAEWEVTFHTSNERAVLKFNERTICTSRELQQIEINDQPP